MASGDKVSIILIEHDPFYRGGLETLIEVSKHLQLAATIGSVADALPLGGLKADIILLDGDDPHHRAADAIGLFTYNLPMAQTIVLSSHTNEAYLQEARQSGACGYLLKDDAVALLQKTILQVTRKNRHYQQSGERVFIASKDRSKGIYHGTSQKI